MDDFPDILRHQRILLDVLHRLDAPAPAIGGAEDTEADVTALLHHPIGAVGTTGTPLVALVDGGAEGNLLCPSLSVTTLHRP